MIVQWLNHFEFFFFQKPDTVLESIKKDDLHEATEARRFTLTPFRIAFMIYKFYLRKQIFLKTTT